MHRPFQGFYQILNLLIACSQARVHGDWGDYEGLQSRFLHRVDQAEVEQTIDRPLEGVARAPLLLLDEHGNVVVNSESLSHIMML